MRWSALAPLGLLVVQACSSSAAVSARLQATLAEMPEDSPARLWLEGDRIAAAAVATGPGSLPQAVRTAVEAVEPGGETVFQGREWGARGEGYRVDKHYVLAGQDHRRTALVAADGRVLERGHSVPIAEVPQAVLAAALDVGPTVVEAMIVSGPEVEEFWRCEVTDRLGRSYVVTVGLDGGRRGVVRRVAATVGV
ncbi:MAG: hypothetical protein U1E73_03180 [Planctomycetota bacterium]